MKRRGHSFRLTGVTVCGLMLGTLALSTPADAKGLLLTAIRDPDPVLFLEPQRLYRMERSEVPDGDHTVPFGQSRVARAGSDVTLVAWSAAVELCERAAGFWAEAMAEIVFSK